jgi:hypothetical protein
MFRTLGAGLSFLIGALLVACGGGGGGGGDSGSNGGGGTGGGGTPPNTIAMTGNFGGGTHASSLDKLFAWLLRPAHALAPSAVAKVIAISTEGTATTAEVTNGFFSVSVEKDKPVGLVFADAGDKFLGYVSLAGGIDSVPIGKVRSGLAAIDLSALSSTGQIVSPASNPLGSDLPLTTDEQTAIRHSNSNFASVIRNPDVDGNGRIDALEQKFFRLQIFYFVVAGSFAGNLTPQVTTPASVRSSRIDLAVVDVDPPSSVTFSGPPGSGLSDSTAPSTFLGSGQPGQAVFATYSAPSGMPPAFPSIPVAGQYTVGYKTQTLTFTVPDESTAASDIVLPVPSVTLNSDGTVQRLSWAYRLGSGSPALDPQAVIRDIAFNIEGGGPQCPGNGGPPRPYASDRLSATTTEHVLRCQNIPWTSVTQIFMTYTDLYGNARSASWDRP